MRIHVLGDLHMEFGAGKIPTPEADVVVLAGDVDVVGTKGLAWIHSHFNGRPVVYVLGNQEFYRHALPELTDTLRRDTAGSSIHLLENAAVEVNGFTFLGCTLRNWDICMLTWPARGGKASMATIVGCMNCSGRPICNIRAKMVKSSDHGPLCR